MTSTTAIPESAPPPTGARRLLRPISYLLWGAVLVFAASSYLTDRSPSNLVLLVVFVLLCVAINTESRIRAFAQKRAWRHESMRLDNRFSIDGEIDLPNRTYLLSEIRREIARASTSGLPFTLVHLSLHDFEKVRTRRGDEFANRVLNSMTGLVRRVTRQTDFLAHLGGASFVVMLVDSGKQDANEFLKSAIPGWISASDGHNMYDVTIVARMLEYDLDGIYSADILAELEASPPLMREQRDMAHPA